MDDNLTSTSPPSTILTMNNNNNLKKSLKQNNLNKSIKSINQSSLKTSSSPTSTTASSSQSSSTMCHYPFFTCRLIKSSYLGLRKLKKRYLILMMCMMMNALSYTIRTNINMTIVAMVKDDNPLPSTNHTIDFVDDSCPNRFDKEDDVTISNMNFFQSSANDTDWISNHNEYLFLRDKAGNGEDGDADWRDNLFDWSESLQGTIVGAFYYGYILTNFNGGQMSEWVGTKRLLTISMALSSLLTLLVPMSAYCHPWLLIMVRVLTGVAQGVVTPAIYQLLSYWTPRSELGTAFGLIPASGYIGAVITMPVCAFLSELEFFGGWPSVFYCFGSIGIISLIPWWLFVYDAPDAHPTITADELNYVQSNSMTTKKKKQQLSNGRTNSWVPWCSIISSSKIWAITVTKFCTSWGNLFLMSKLPTYLSQILHMPITYNSYVNASIYIALGGSYLSWGTVADWVEKRQCLGRTASRKLFQTIALLGSAAFMASIPLFGCNIMLIIIMLNLSMITLGLTAGGDSLIIVDVAPDYSGSIYGFSNSIGSLPGFLAPLFVGLMLDQPNSNQMQQWSLLFWIGSGIYVFGALIFLLFVDSNVESWGRRATTSMSSSSKQSYITNNSSNGQSSFNSDGSSKSNKNDSKLCESDPLSNITACSSASNTSSETSTSTVGQSTIQDSSDTTTTIIQVESNDSISRKNDQDRNRDINNSDIFYIKV